MRLLASEKSSTRPLTLFLSPSKPLQASTTLSSACKMALSSSLATPPGKHSALHDRPVPCKQRRIVRTYGQKRSAPDTVDADESTASASKIRQRNELEDNSNRGEDEGKEGRKGEASRDALTGGKPTTTAAETAATGSNNAKKAVGIMRYFQPAATAAHSSLSETHTSTPFKDDTEEKPALPSSLPSSPSSSPVAGSAVRRPRSKRRLTIRPDQLAQLTTDKEKASTLEAESSTTPTGNTNSTGSMVASSMRMRKRLRMSGPGRHNQQTAPSIQTTLSLGGGSDAFRECKECNVLYNPLHEKDVKFHARYHASVCQKQSSESGE